MTNTQGQITMPTSGAAEIGEQGCRPAQNALDPGHHDLVDQQQREYVNRLLRQRQHANALVKVHVEVNHHDQRQRVLPEQGAERGIEMMPQKNANHRPTRLGSAMLQ